MDAQSELRQLGDRRQAYLSTVQDPGRTCFEREVALGDLELIIEGKIAKLQKRISTHDEAQFDVGGEA